MGDWMRLGCRGSRIWRRVPRERRTEACHTLMINWQRGGELNIVKDASRNAKVQSFRGKIVMARVTKELRLYMSSRGRGGK